MGSMTLPVGVHIVGLERDEPSRDRFAEQPERQRPQPDGDKTMTGKATRRVIWRLLVIGEANVVPGLFDERVAVGRRPGLCRPEQPLKAA